MSSRATKKKEVISYLNMGVTVIIGRGEKAKKLEATGVYPTAFHTPEELIQHLTDFIQQARKAGRR